MATPRDVRHRLRELGWSQRQLAQAMGVSDCYVSLVCHGKSPVTASITAVMDAALAAKSAMREAVNVQ